MDYDGKEVAARWKPDLIANPDDRTCAHTPTVGAHAASAEQAVRAHTDARMDGLQPEYVSDLISHLLHLCDREGLDPREVLGRGVRCYVDERDPELGEPAIDWGDFIAEVPCE